MKIKHQFLILSLLIISIPILCATFVVIHTYIHSPNRYLIKGSAPLRKEEFPLLSAEDYETLKISLQMLPQEVQALLFQTTDKKILYSSMPELEAGMIIQKDEIWNFATRTSDRYFYQFSKIPSAGDNVLLITRLAVERIKNEQKTKLSLKILLIVIFITIISLILIILISKSIFEGLRKIESSSRSLAEGNFDKSVSIDLSPSKYNEFSSIMTSLEKMRCELLEMQSRKNRFITGISHDLRTPVAVIKGYTEAIKDNVITDKKEILNSIDLIERKASQLEGMIDTLINYMKLNNAEIKEKLKKNSISTLIRNYAKYCEITGKVFKRNVKTNIALPDNIEVPLNDELVHRAFENLFSNAIRYTRENDLIEINAWTSQNEKDKAIIMQVKDSGYGIDKKDLDFIFDIFYRGTNSRQEEGMGVGLAVVKNIMETHGWKISVESQKKKGSCFTITIPY